MNEPILQQCLRMLEERCDFFSAESQKGESSFDRLWNGGHAAAYESARDMLRYALDGNREALNQFDYYGE